MARIHDLSSSDIQDGFGTFVTDWHKFATSNQGKFKEATPKDVIAFGKTLASNRQQLKHLAKNISMLMANKAGLAFAQKGARDDPGKTRDWKPGLKDKAAVKIQKGLVKVALHERKGELSLVLHRMMKQSVLLAQGGTPVGEKAMMKEMGADEDIAVEKVT